MRFERITFDPQIMGGRACIRGMRITQRNIPTSRLGERFFAALRMTEPGASGYSIDTEKRTL